LERKKCANSCRCLSHLDIDIINIQGEQQEEALTLLSGSESKIEESDIVSLGHGLCRFCGTILILIFYSHLSQNDVKHYYY
jgi:hypothetical protein